MPATDKLAVRIATNLFTTCAALFTLSVAATHAADVTATWDSSTNHWSDAVHWTSANFPNNGNGGQTYDASIQAGSVTVDQPITIEGLSLTSGTINLDQDLTLQSGLQWSSGQLASSGVLRASGETLINNASTAFLDTTLELRGNADWTGNGAISWSRNQGLIHVPAAGNLVRSGVDNVIALVNLRVDTEGSFHQTNTATTDFRGGTLENNGNVTIDAGTLQLNSTATGNGSYGVGPLGTLEFRATGSELAGSVTGSGIVRANGGTTTLLESSIYSVSQTEFTSGRIIFASNNTAELGTTQLAAGSLEGPGAKTLQTLQWTGGSIAGGVAQLLGASTIEGARQKFLDAPLRIEDTLTWSGRGTISWSRNQGTLQVANNAALLRLGTEDSILLANAQVDAGGLLRHGNSGTTQVRSNFINNGAVAVETGSLQLTGSTSGSGSFVVSESATLEFGGTSDAMQHSISGAGTVRFASNSTTFASPARYNVANTISVSGRTNFDVDGTVDLGKTELAAGRIGGTSSKRMAELQWTGGTLAGPTLLSGPSVMEGAAQKFLDGTLEIANTLEWTGRGAISWSRNQGTLHVADGGRLVRSGDEDVTVLVPLQVDSDGTFHVNNPGSTQFRSEIDNQGTIIVDAGTLVIQANTLANYDSEEKTLTNGTFDLAATFQFPGADINTNRSEIVLRGQDAVIQNPNAADALADVSTNDISGMLRVFERDFATSSGFDNGGILELRNASFTAPSLNNGDTGTILGFGSINNDLLNRGKLAVGSDGVEQFSSLNIMGELDNRSTSTTQLGLVEWTEDNDEVTVTGSAQLSGTLSLEFHGDAPLPERGTAQRHRLLTANSIEATFDDVLVGESSLQPSFPPAANGSFRSHVNEGHFRWLTYHDDRVELTSYVAVAGDSNGDGMFATDDLVQVFRSGSYEDDTVGNSTWLEGDWNLDGDFDSSDLVAAFMVGEFETGLVFEAASPVPEPKCRIGFLLALLMLVRWRCTREIA